MNARDHLNSTTEQLEKLNTRQLMALRRDLFGAANKCGCPVHCGDEGLPQDEREENQQIYALADRVKVVLSTREHIPSKAEGKELRRAAAKKGR